jgi:hypothetical protein
MLLLSEIQISLDKTNWLPCPNNMGEQTQFYTRVSAVDAPLPMWMYVYCHITCTFTGIDPNGNEQYLASATAEVLRASGATFILSISSITGVGDWKLKVDGHVERSPWGSNEDVSNTYDWIHLVPKDLFIPGVPPQMVEMMKMIMPMTFLMMMGMMMPMMMSSLTPAKKKEKEEAEYLPPYYPPRELPPYYPPELPPGRYYYE